MCYLTIPPGHPALRYGNGSEEEEASVCMMKTPLIAVMVTLSVALLLCLAITAWMFRRMRQTTSDIKKTSGGSLSFSNSGFKS